MARFTRLPILGSLIEYLLFDGDRIFQLPHDGVIHVDEPVEQPPEMVLPSRVVAHFIEQARYHWIMDICICRDASGCRDYPVDLGCLFLGEAVLGINPKLGRLVTREEALAHVERCREAGLVHIIGRNKLDTVWLGIGPGDRLMTICNCCPCCCLWRMLPQLDPGIADRVTGMPGVTVSVTEACAGCGTCTQEVCFVDAIHLDGHRAVITDACRGCGRCVTACPQNAIEFSIDDGRFIDRSIHQLSSLVDVA
jgi:ferredoxin